MSLPNTLEDWRFRDCPHVASGGIRAYAGAPLNFETEFGETVALGSICVASDTTREPLTRPQQLTLARLSDWLVTDIIQYSRARRQRERRRMAERLAEAQKTSDDDATAEESVMDILRATYPDAQIGLQYSDTSHINLEGRDPISASDLNAGIWEDIDYIDEFIANYNHQELSSDRTVRVMAARCEDTTIPSFLVVASKDFRLVFDDVDSWFVQACADLLSRIGYKRRLAEAMRAREKFLRGITHQLRTPIHGILGSADLLAEELKSRNQQRRYSLHTISTEDSFDATNVDPLTYIDTIKTSGRDLISVVNSMITLNRWTDISRSKRIDTLKSVFDLERDLSNHVIKATSWDSRHKSSIFFNHEISSHCDSLWIDTNLFNDSIIPLIMNAIQNTSNGIVVVTISIRSDIQELLVDVEDTGCGIHPKYQKRIFDAYEKVDFHSAGAGLGLTLASNFAELLNGSIVLVSSDLNKGSHFRATFREIAPVRTRRPSQYFKATLKSLPSTYYQVSTGTGETSLCNPFARFLEYHGFSPSTTPDNSITILDYTSNLELREARLLQIPRDQVAICLIPADEGAACLDDIPKNIVCLRGPFLSSTLIAALEQADEILSELGFIKAKHLLTPQLETPPVIVPVAGEVSDADASSTYLNGASRIPSSLEDPIGMLMGTITSLPLKSAMAAHLENVTKTPVIPTLTSSKPAALLVDDNAINLRIMQMYCKKRGLSYYCARDGQQAVEIYSQKQSSPSTSARIDLVLMDLQMPVCDGIEATRQIRLLEKQNNWRKSVLFIVTGQDSPSDRTDAEEVGADKYLVKPVDIKLLDRNLRGYFPAFEIG